MDPYSNLVRFAKLTSLIGACALLTSLVFLVRVSNKTLETSETPLPFSTSISGSMTNTITKGANRRGELFEFETAKTLFGSRKAPTKLEDLKGHIDLTSGTQISFEADTGSFLQADNQFTFSGNVLLRTSDGTKLETESLQLFSDQYSGFAPNPVHILGPWGNVKSNTLRFSWKTSELHFNFLGDVVFLYDPTLGQAEKR